jgi:hypothetical protein
MSTAHVIGSNVLNFVPLNGATIKKSFDFNSVNEFLLEAAKRVIANMATCRKMEHLREWKEVVCWDATSREPRPKVQFLEMLHYPDRQEPVVDEGNLDDSILPEWFSKVAIKPCCGLC